MSLFPYFLHKHWTWIFSCRQCALMRRCIQSGHCVDEPLSVPATDTKAAWQTTRSFYVINSCPPRLHLPAHPTECESDNGQCVCYSWCEHSRKTVSFCSGATRLRLVLGVSRIRRPLSGHNGNCYKPWNLWSICRQGCMRQFRYRYTNSYFIPTNCTKTVL